MEQDTVADADVLATHLVEVVEGGAGDRGAGDLDRPQVRHRRQRPGTTDIGHDVLDDGLDLLGRELVGDGPARRPADHAQAALVVEAVDLDDDAVRLVGQLVARLAPALGEGDDALDVEPGLRGWARPGSPAPRGARGRPTAFDAGRAALLEEDVEPGREVAAGRHPRVDLAQRARTAVARVGVERQALLLALRVDARELRLGHVDLAAHLERDRLRQPLRDGPDRAQVGRHVLAGAAVAARRTEHEAAGLVAQADGQAVDLQLGDVGRSRLVGGQAQPAAHARVEGAQLVGVEGVAQREHGRAMLDVASGPRLGRTASAGAPTRWVGESGVTSSGCAASSSTSSRKRRSYSASLISGASSSW